MKIIQGRELCRIKMMIAGDKEMSQLACRILEKKEVFRFSWSTILLFHILLFSAIVTIAVHLASGYKLGLYFIPVITFCILQAVWSIVHLITIAEFRKEYNEYLQKIIDS